MFDFLSIKKSVEAIRASHLKLDADLQAVKREIQAVREAPIHRSEIVGLIDQWIARSAAGFDQAVASKIKARFVGRPSSSGPFNLGFMDLCAQDVDRPDAAAMDAVMCRVFGASIRNHVVSVVESMDFPGEGLRTAERAAKLAELAEREKKIRQELIQIIKSAEDAGIEL